MIQELTGLTRAQHVIESVVCVDMKQTNCCFGQVIYRIFTNKLNINDPSRAQTETLQPHTLAAVALQAFSALF